MKWAILNTKSTMVITTSNPIDFTMKSMLIVFHFASETGRECSSLIDRC